MSASVTVRQLAPEQDVSFDCPHCDTGLRTTGWRMPGMRVLASLECPACQRTYFGDYPAGDGYFGQALLERDTGEVHADRDDFFTKWLRESWAARSSEPVDVEWTTHREIDEPVVLNCLDTMYGHCLRKLFYAQYHVDEDDRDLVVIVPANLAWMVPDGAAAVWAVDLPLGRGTEWNDWLADQFESRLSEYGSVAVSCNRPFPINVDVDIERFTGVEPFPLDEWESRSADPTVTFVWRDDRQWSRFPPTTILYDWLGGRTARWVVENPVMARAGDVLDSVNRRIQQRRVIELASEIRSLSPGVEFAVAGLGASGGLPDWIADERVSSPTTSDERRLCQRYAGSQVVIGVHGSNMLLPSAHAPVTIDLMPSRRWGNLEQDLLSRHVDSRETGFHYHLLPLDTEPARVADLASAVLDAEHRFD
ncbi:hypothetical protein [Halobaculum sp. D14]|uniref:hypothetical protein n=1 Tax=Halobaculum sp. D14 TaxID=3421642 RepID=UPI003EBCDBB1